MKVTIRNIADVYTGVFASIASEGELVYLQTRHFDDSGRLQAALFPDLEREKRLDKHLLKSGDVLFAAKGTRNFALHYEEKNVPAVASTSFFVIRLRHTATNTILPAYLAWSINHPKKMSYLKSLARGTSMVSISKSALAALEIEVPPLHIQQMILKISELRHSEKELLERIEKLKEQCLQQQILIAISKT